VGRTHTEPSRDSRAITGTRTVNGWATVGTGNDSDQTQVMSNCSISKLKPVYKPMRMTGQFKLLTNDGYVPIGV